MTWRGKKGFLPLFLMTRTNSLDYEEKKCKGKEENVLLPKQCTLFFSLIKIFFFDFKSKLGRTHVKKQIFFMYSKFS